MINYFIDLNVFSYENKFYTEKSNIDRINYLFGEVNLILIVPRIILVSEIDNYFLKEINYKVIATGNNIFFKIDILKKSPDNFVLLTGNNYFITTFFAFILALNRFNLIFVGSVSNSYYYSKLSVRNGAKYVLAFFAEFISFLLARKIYAAGGDLSNKFFFHLFKKKVYIFNTTYFKSYEDFNHDFKERYESNIIVFVGLVSSQKGMDENIRFFEKINSISKNKYKLIVVGKKINDDYNEFLSKKNVEYKGYLSDKTEIRRIFSNAKFLILQSKHEGMARSPLEAMYYSIPVLTNGVGTRYYCTINNSIINVNPEGLAASADQLSFDEYCRMSEAAFQTSKLFNGKESPVIR